MVRSKDSATSSKALTLIAAVLVVAALYFGREVLVPLALGLVFSFLLTPVVSQLEKLRIGRPAAVLIVLACALGLVGVVSWGVADQLVQIMAKVPDYKSNLDIKIRSLHISKNGNLSKATATMQELNKELAAVPGQISSNQAREQAQGSPRAAHPIPVQVAAPPTNIVQDLRDLLGPLAGVLETAAIVSIFTVFMLLKREDLRNRAIRLAGRGQLTVMTHALDDAAHRLSRYLLMQSLVNSGYGLVVGTCLYFIGVPHAFLWGVLAALLRFIPYVGILAAAAFPITMALAVFPGWRQAAFTVGLFVTLEVSVANFLEPYVYGGNTGISSLAILVAAIFWTTLWGPVGLILSTPLTVCLIVLGRYAPQLQFLEVVLGDEPVLAPEQHFYQRLLAMDDEEARKVALNYLKEHSLESLYESIFIPALKLGEHDYQVDGVDDDTRKFMLHTTRDLIEEFNDEYLEQQSKLSAENNPDSAAHQHLPAEQRLKIVCIPARNGPDELIIMMLGQLLQRDGYSPRFIRTETFDNLSAELARQKCDVACVSSLSPFGISQARSLCKKLPARFPHLQVVIGLWRLDVDGPSAKERLGNNCTGIAVTTLSDAIAQVRKLAGAGSNPALPSPSPEPSDTLVRSSAT